LSSPIDTRLAIGAITAQTVEHYDKANIHPLADIEARLTAKSPERQIIFRQSNHEGELVDWVQECSRDGSALILNAGAYTHTSVALHDALRACQTPIIEVHLSNPAARESFRKRNFVASVAKGTIAG